MKDANLRKYSFHNNAFIPNEYEFLQTESEHFNSTSAEHREFWNKQNVTYRLNSYGFRGDEFDTDSSNSILFLGDSITFGLGMPEKAIFPTLIGAAREVKIFNLGIPGGSYDSAFRVYNEWAPILKPKYTVLYIPYPERCEVAQTVDTNENKSPLCHNGPVISPHENIGPWTLNFLLKREQFDTAEWVSNAFFEDNYQHTNTEKNTNAIENIARNINSKLIHIKGEEAANYTSLIRKFETARDNAHPGFNWHMMLNDTIMNKIKLAEGNTELW